MTSPDVAHRRLHNQHITRQTFEKPSELVGWMAAIQAQDYAGAKWSVGLRLPGSTDADIEQAIVDRRILRTWALRGTLHVVAAADIRWLVALIAPRIRAANARRYRELELDDNTLARSNDVIANALHDAGGRQLTRKDLFEILEENGISTRGQRGVYLLQRASLDNLTCQGVMQGRDSTFMIPPNARTLAHDEAAAELAKRYFASRGPATLKDFTWWSGLAASDARAGLEAAKSGLVEEKINGQTCYLQSSSTVKDSSKSPIYLLPGFDEYLLGYTDRSSVLDPQHAKKVLPGGGIFSPTIVMDGQVVGTWKRTIKKGAVVITPAPFRPMTATERDALESAAQRFGRFLGMPVALV
jgi:hypothetical protein